MVKGKVTVSPTFHFKSLRVIIDPAARDYILKTILTNYNENASVIITTHLISDVEKVLDDVVFIKNGEIVFHKDVDVIREEKNMSIDSLFREVFAC